MGQTDLWELPKAELFEIPQNRVAGFEVANCDWLRCHYFQSIVVCVVLAASQPASQPAVAAAIDTTQKGMTIGVKAQASHK